jgi:TetR/AcrR family transcriptional regulator, transcriptional repressor for nem operon
MYQKHDKDVVIKKGIELFCAKGYNNLGIDKICKTTGMTKGAFYNAFKSKEQFLLATIMAYGKMTVAHLDKKLNHNESKAIDRLIGMYENMFEMQPNINYTGCMINNIMSELGTSNQLVGEATAIEFENFLNVIEPIVAEAQRDGDLKPSISSSAITELLHATFYGSLTRAKSTREFNHGKRTMTLLINSLKQ